MKDRILLFGFWRQWEKYYNYFLKKWCIIETITLTWWKRRWVITKIYDDVILSQEYLDSFDCIVVAVLPHEQQEKIIQCLIDMKVSSRIILEKPITYNQTLLKKLRKKQNIYFFIDEVFLFDIYKKFSSFNNPHLFIWKFKDTETVHLLEHIFWGFLLSKKFKDILSHVKIELVEKKIRVEDLVYIFTIENKYKIFCKKGSISLNWNKIVDIAFDTALDYILCLSREQGVMYKKNFCILRKFLLLRYKSENYK